jgi:Pyruvate-formate lyase-activating enzyme
MIDGVNLMPEKLVNLALEYDADGIAYTYNEPTIFIEYAHDTGVLAKRKGLFNVFVSNGYASPESVKLMLDFLDAITVDFKGNGEKRFLQKYAMVVDPEPIFQTLLELKKNNVHIEITDLIVPRVGDNLDGTELEFVIMVIAVSCVKLLSAHNSTQHTSRKHKV